MRQVLTNTSFQIRSKISNRSSRNSNPRRMRTFSALANSLTIGNFLCIILLIFWDQVHLGSGQQFFSGTLGNSGIININPSSGGIHGGSDEWDGTFRSGSYGNGYTCVNIPTNFTLCKNMDYSKMMVPNLLGHDSLQEAEFHAKSWIPLLRLQCHADTQLFLCSLFSPICLDRPIYPCRSLCQVVQASCEPRMLPYNYPWPSMLKCDQFPEDHDLCIRPGAANTEQKKVSIPSGDTECPSCNQAHTCENIVDHFCRSEFAFRAKFEGMRGSSALEFRKGRWFKPKDSSRRGRSEFQAFDLESKDSCCLGKVRTGLPYIVMGVLKGNQRLITFMMPWNGKDKVLKNAVKTFRSMDCSNPLPMSVMAVGNEQRNRNETRSNSGNGSRRRRRKQGNNNGRRRGRQYGGCRVVSSGKNP